MHSFELKNTRIWYFILMKLIQKGPFDPFSFVCYSFSSYVLLLGRFAAGSAFRICRFERISRKIEFYCWICQKPIFSPNSFKKRFIFIKRFLIFLLDIFKHIVHFTKVFRGSYFINLRTESQIYNQHYSLVPIGIATVSIFFGH